MFDRPAPSDAHTDALLTFHLWYNLQRSYGATRSLVLWPASEQALPHLLQHVDLHLDLHARPLAVPAPRRLPGHVRLEYRRLFGGSSECMGARGRLCSDQRGQLARSNAVDEQDHVQEAQTREGGRKELHRPERFRGDEELVKAVCDRTLGLFHTGEPTLTKVRHKHAELRFFLRTQNMVFLGAILYHSAWLATYGF